MFDSNSNSNNDTDSEPTEAVLYLKKFASKPLVDFGTIKLGSSSTVALRIENPNSTEQEITVEKIPTKAGFSLREVVFNVPAGGHTRIDITWLPETVGNTRESLQLKWGRFNLQAVLFGVVVAKETKKRARRENSTIHRDAKLQRGLDASFSAARKRAVHSRQLNESNLSVLNDMSLSMNDSSILSTTQDMNSSVLSFSANELSEKPRSYQDSVARAIQRANSSFKAGNLDRRILNGPIGVPQISSRPSTKPQSFNLSMSRSFIQDDETSMNRSSISHRLNTSVRNRNVMNTSQRAANKMHLQQSDDTDKENDCISNAINGQRKQSVASNNKALQSERIVFSPIRQQHQPQQPTTPSNDANNNNDSMCISPALSEASSKRTMRARGIKNVSPLLLNSSNLISKLQKMPATNSVVKAKTKPAVVSTNDNTQDGESSPVIPSRLVSRLAGTNTANIKLSALNMTSNTTASTMADASWGDSKDNVVFQQWSNFILNSHLFIAEKDGNVSIGSNTAALQLEHKRRLTAVVRERIAQIYESSEMHALRKRIEKEIDEGKMNIREDRNLHEDIAIRSDVLTILFSYHPVWLRLALETVLKQRIPTATDEIAVLAKFMYNNLLSSPTLSRQTILGSQQKRTVNKHTLLTFLLIVKLLDSARPAKVLDEDIILFNKESNIKTSKDVIVAFSRQYLRGEGDVMRHLSFLGYSVSYAQQPIEEFDFAVRDLSVDLRDGIRLCKIIDKLMDEPLAATYNIMKKVRYPAVSRLQKIHNVNLCLETLSAIGADISTLFTSGLKGEEIACGNRQKTVGLLWFIFVHFKVPIVVDETIVHTEIKKIEKTCAPGFKEFRRKMIQMKAATRIQAFYRGSRLRLRFLSMRAAAVCVQRRFREKQQRRMEAHLKALSQHSSAAVAIQSVFRGFLAQRAYQNARRNIVAIQSLWRMIQQRRCFQQTRNTIIAAQALARTAIASDRYQQIRNATIVIQYWYRMVRRQRFERLCSAVVRMQALFRGNRDRLITKQLRAAEQLQTLIRGKQQRQHFLQQRNAAIAIQSNVRRWIAVRIYTAIQERRAQAATRISAWYRAVKQRAEYLRSRNAIIRVQSLARTRKAQHEYTQLRVAVRSMQRRYRANVQRMDFLMVRYATLILQRAFRFRQAEIERKQRIAEQRKRVQAAVALQSILRSRNAQHQYVQQRALCIRVQAQFRANRARNAFIELRQASIVLQSAFRSLKARRLVAAHRAARTIQSAVRTYMARKRYNRERERVVALQTVFRARAESAKYQTERKAAITIQSFVRMTAAREQFLSIRFAAIIIQVYWRQRQQRIAQLRNRSACLIQSAFRGFVARKYASVLRTEREAERLRQFNQMQKAAVVIQSQYRRVLARRRYIQTRSQHIEAVTKIQAIARMNTHRRMFLSIRSAVIKTQAVARGFLARAKYHRSMECVSFIQARFRFRRYYNELLDARECAALTLQSIFRARCVRLYVASLRAQLQQQQQQAELYHELTNAAVIIQRRFREHRRVRIARAQQAAAIKIQAVWRGKMVRKQMGFHAKEILRRIEVINARTEEPMKLSNRHQTALTVLLGSKSMSQVMQACASLAVTTEFSLHCCETLANGGAVPIILSVIKSCNRSQPHMEVLKHCLAILGNLASRNSTATSVFSAKDAVDVIVEQLQVHKEREDVFMRAVQVLTLLCKDPIRAATIGKMSMVVRRLQSLLQALQRKQAMDKRQPPSIAASSTSMHQSRLNTTNMSFAGSFAVNSSRRQTMRSTQVNICCSALRSLLSSIPT